jgi:RNA polymerase sigma-70 factor (ECF subfamily)
VPSTIDCAGLEDGALARRVSGAETAEARAAEAELCRRFGRRARLYGLRHLRSPEAAEDLAQRVLMVTLQKLRGGQVREPDRIGSFVLGVARMVAGEMRHGHRMEVPVSADGAELPRVEPTEPDPLVSAHLARCLEQLTERERSVVALTYYGDASARAIADRLAVAEGHVRVIRHRAIGRLRACLGHRDGGAPARRTRPEAVS